MIRTILIAIAALSPGAGAFAAEYQDLAEIDARVAAALGESGTAMPVDRRIKLIRCPQDVTIDSPAAGAVAVRCPAVGWRIRVPLTGAAATSAAAAPLVRRGDQVQLDARGAGFAVTTVGTALDDGAAGSTIRVKIPTTPQPVAATVTRAGSASIFL